MANSRQSYKVSEIINISKSFYFSIIRLRLPVGTVIIHGTQQKPPVTFHEVVLNLLQDPSKYTYLMSQTFRA